MSDELEYEIAAALRAAEANVKPIEPFAAKLGKDDIACAYRVQHINTEHAVSSGRTLCGRKIGLTAKTVQEQLGVDEPDYGALFSDMRIADSGSVDLSKLISPRIEAEIALVLEVEITQKNLPPRELEKCVSYAAPALEIVDSRLRDWRIGIVDTISDNGASARFVIGEKQHFLHGLDLSTCQMKLLKNGDIVSSGSGNASMGGPLNALAWLANILIDHKMPLQPGDLILTGALGPVVTMSSGDSFNARFDQLSEVSLNVR